MIELAYTGTAVTQISRPYRLAIASPVSFSGGDFLGSVSSFVRSAVVDNVNVRPELAPRMAPAALGHKAEERWTSPSGAARFVQADRAFQRIFARFPPA